MTDTIMNLYMGNYSVPPSHEAALLFGQPWDAFLPPLAGSFLGVFFGFLLNYVSQYKQKCDHKRYYKKAILDEIEQCITALRGLRSHSEITHDVFSGLSKNRFVRTEMVVPIPKSEIFLLSTDRWTSARNSGALRFFKVEEADMLSRAYGSIEKYNYEANMTRIGEEEVRRNPGHENIAYGWSCSVDQLERSKEKLLIELELLKDEKWLAL